MNQLASVGVLLVLVLLMLDLAQAEQVCDTSFGSCNAAISCWLFGLDSTIFNPNTGNPDQCDGVISSNFGTLTQTLPTVTGTLYNFETPTRVTGPGVVWNLVVDQTIFATYTDNNTGNNPHNNCFRAQGPYTTIQYQRLSGTGVLYPRYASIGVVSTANCGTTVPNRTLSTHLFCDGNFELAGRLSSPDFSCWTLGGAATGIVTRTHGPALKSGTNTFFRAETSQTIHGLTIGRNYTVFYFVNFVAPSVFPSNANLTIYADNRTVAAALVTGSVPVNTWTKKSAQFGATRTNALLLFATDFGSNPGLDTYYLIDDVTVVDNACIYNGAAPSALSLGANFSGCTAVDLTFTSSGTISFNATNAIAALSIDIGANNVTLDFATLTPSLTSLSVVCSGAGQINLQSSAASPLALTDLTLRCSANLDSISVNASNNVLIVEPAVFVNVRGSTLSGANSIRVVDLQDMNVDDSQITSNGFIDISIV